ncbi:MAG: hypothetical protein ACI9FB_004155 [Candidatus Azotimanducaceae bacterium]|jgi:hypothetical protein
MQYSIIGLFLFSLILLPGEGLADTYFPQKDNWIEISPKEAGFNEARLNEAIEFAKTNETKLPEQLAKYLDVKDLEKVRSMYSFTKEPFDEVIGPMKPRGEFTGMIIRNGYIVAEWGEPHRVDMTHSITKTFLSSTAGLAYDRGLIKNVNDLVEPYVPTEHFSSQHNRTITWDHLLRQSSYWRGELWGKPDWADRPGKNTWAEFARETPASGTKFKYNDVRVNALALALLHLWRKPLPSVLKEHLMDPIGATNTWRWHGYKNSWVNIDGQQMQSVSGGGHWGGGMFISARDLARLGLLALNKGRWEGKKILSEDWINMSRTPGPDNLGYGYMNYFLNTSHKRLPDLPESSYYFAGAGSNIIFIDETKDLIVVVRWIDGKAINEFFSLVRQAIISSE